MSEAVRFVAVRGDGMQIEVIAHNYVRDGSGGVAFNDTNGRELAYVRDIACVAVQLALWKVHGNGK